MKMRTNISFDQVLNQVRKDERDFILGLLTERKDALARDQDFERGVVFSDMIKLIKESVHQPVQTPVNQEGA